MPGKPETLADCFYAGLYEDTDRRPIQWCPISTIAAPAPIREDHDLRAAIVAAVVCRVGFCHPQGKYGLFFPNRRGLTSDVASPLPD